MPIYEYECTKCGEFEYRQSLNDPTLKRCPTCRSKVTKLISSSAFQLKGGGWYSDAYQKKGSSKAAAPAASSSDSSPSTASTAAPSVAAPSTSGSSSGSGSSD